MIYDANTGDYNCRIIDRATGKDIPNVVWCDDVSGEYDQLVTDAASNRVPDPETGMAKKRRCKGSFVVFRIKSEGED